MLECEPVKYFNPLVSKVDFWNDRHCEVIPISALHRSVECDNTTFYEKLKNDISANGLSNPIMIVEARVWQYQDQMKLHPSLLPLPPALSINPMNNCLIVWGGSSRVKVALDLGYDAISIIRFTGGDFCSPWDLQPKQRIGFDHLYT